MEVAIQLTQVVAEFGLALKAVDARRPVGKAQRFKPGAGPLTESELTNLIAAELRAAGGLYSECGPRGYPHSRNTCDLIIPSSWALEIKLARPFGDNGKPAERWSENLLYPYAGNTSSIGDCLKLLESGFSERLGVLVVAYEHVPARIPVEPAVRAFELIARDVVGIRLSPRAAAVADELVHPCHQRATVYGREVLGRGN